MAKRKSKAWKIVLLFVLFAVIIVGAFLFAQQSLSGFSDGYIPYGNSDVAITNASTCKIVAGSTPNSPAQGQCSPGQFWNLDIQGIYSGSWRGGWSYSGSDSDFSLGMSPGSYGNCGQCSELAGSLISTLNVKSKNFKVDTKINFGGNGNGATGRSVTFFLQGSNGEVFNVVTKDWSGSKYDSGAVYTGTVELQWSILDSGKVQVNYQGMEVGTYNFTSPSVFFGMRESINGGYGGGVTGELFNARWQPVISCTKEMDEISALETFREGNNVGLFSTRYPVQKLCGTIITTPTGVDFSASREIEARLVKGDTLTVPQGSTWTVLYIAKQSPSMPVICKGSDVLAGSTCTDMNGILQVCSKGQTDINTGVCATQPENLVNCSGRYEISTNSCFINPPNQYTQDCTSFGSDYAYNALENACVNHPVQYHDCSKYGVDASYDATKDACITISKNECSDSEGIYVPELGWCINSIPTQAKTEIVNSGTINQQPVNTTSNEVPDTAVIVKEPNPYAIFYWISGILSVVIVFIIIIFFVKKKK